MADKDTMSNDGHGHGGEYELHYFPFSLYSLMVRFALTLGRQLNSKGAPSVRLRFVDLHKHENLSEEYLTTVNSKGQVPSLTSSLLPAPLSDSHQIAKWLCQRQPDLVPAAHKESIDTLMDKLYSLHFKALNIPPEAAANGIPNVAAAMLEKGSISERHRRALEIKSIFHDSLHSRTIEPEHIARVEAHVADLMQEVDAVMGEHRPPQGSRRRRWIFGGQTPTILDAHVAALAIRLLDTDRLELLPATVQEYAKAVQQSSEWKSVTNGRPTVWDESMGPVAELDRNEGELGEVGI